MADDRSLSDEALIASSPLFDAEFYRTRYAGERGETFDPLHHFMSAGARRGHTASPGFVCAAYYALYPDVARRGANPLVHFLRNGQTQGRRAVGEPDLRPLGFGGMTRREQHGVAVVAASPHFDADYFAKTYPRAAKSGLHPILHYVRHGLKRRLNPGPGFDAATYLAQNPDALRKGLPPLVHYHRFGRDAGATIQPAPTRVERPSWWSDLADRIENRFRGAAPSSPVAPPIASSAELASATPVKKKKKAAAAPSAANAGKSAKPASANATADERAIARLIEDSGFFDADWYRSQHPDVAASGIEPALHYARIGGPAGRKPSVRFDPAYYLENNSDAAGSGASALVHFITVGRARGAKPLALAERGEPRDPSTLPVAAYSGATDSYEPYWLRHAEFSPFEADGVSVDGVLLGRAGATAPTSLYAPLIAYARLAALGERSITPQPPRSSWRYDDVTCFGAAFDSGARTTLIDAWFADDLTLRLRLGDPKVDAFGNRSFVVRGFQSTAKGLTLCGEALLPPTGMAIIDLSVTSEFAPVLLVASNGDGIIDGFALIAFPSLLRGGLHHVELLALAARSNPVEDFRALSEAFIRELTSGDSAPPLGVGRIDVIGDDDAGPCATPALRDWLTGLFGFDLAEANVASAALRVAERARGRMTLVLPPDAAPTLSALTSRRLRPYGDDEPATGVFLAVDPTHRPLTSVFLPPEHADLRTVPLLRGAGDSGASAPRATAAAPLAIRVIDAAGDGHSSAGVPGAGGGGSALGVVDVRLFARDEASTRRCLQSLALQSARDRLQVSLVFSSELEAAGEGLAAFAEALFGRPVSSVSSTGSRLRDLAAAALGDTAIVLSIDDAVVLSDPEAVHALADLASGAGVASAGCVLMREDPFARGATTFRSGGLFPSHVSILAAPRLVVSQPDCRDVLAGLVYPVIGNDLSLAALRAEAFHSLSPLVRGVPDGLASDAAFGFAAIAKGWRHMCTAAVSATLVEHPGARREARDPLGAGLAPLDDWSGLLNSVTVLRELR